MQNATKGNPMYGLKFNQSMYAAFERTQGPDAVKLAIKLIRGDVKPQDVSQAARDLIDRCYGRPKSHYLLMTALDDILGTCGTEYLGEVDMLDGPPVEYLNAGDTYTATLVWYRDMNRFRVETYADAVEWCEKRGIEV